MLIHSIIISCLIISLAYALFILLILFKVFSPAKKSITIETINIPVSIIIPYRNEAKNLSKLWQHLSQQDYPIVEIVFVNDHSNDQSEEIIATLNHSSFQLKKLNLPHDYSGKKAAIQFGINQATHDKIICLDADCYPKSKQWIAKMVSNAENFELFGGPVYLENSNHFWSLIQSAENFATQIVSNGMSRLGSPIAINGANMSYSKSFFNDMKPYQFNQNIASGDDIYFLQKVKQKGFRVGQELDENLAVITAASSLKDYFKQRIRWVRKSSSFKDISTILVGFLIFLSLLSFLFGAVYQIVMQELNSQLLISMSVKMGIDFLLLFLIAIKFKRTLLMFVFLPAFLFNIFAFCLVILLGWFIPIQWKNRKI